MSELIFETFDPIKAQSVTETGKEVMKELFVALTKQKTAPALAANQIGSDERVVVVSAREPLGLVNPKIVEESMPFAYMEAHSTFPNRLWFTMRNASILVTADNLKEPVRFGLKPEESDKLFKNGQLNMAVIQHPVVMEACYIQQTIDTLDGIYPEQRKPKLTEPIKKDKKPGRNEIVTLIKDGKSQSIKYKKAQKLLADGWMLVDKETATDIATK